MSWFFYNETSLSKTCENTTEQDNLAEFWVYYTKDSRTVVWDKSFTFFPV